MQGKKSWPGLNLIREVLLTSMEPYAFRMETEEVWMGVEGKQEREQEDGEETEADI